VYWTKFECISDKILRILTTDPRAERVVALNQIVRAKRVQTLCASHAPSGREPKTKNFLTIPFSAGGVGGAGKIWKGKFLVLVPTLHSSRKDLYLYFSIVAIYCPSFPPSFASVRGASVSAFSGNSKVLSHFAPPRIVRSHSLTMPCSVLASCSLCDFVGVCGNSKKRIVYMHKQICMCLPHPPIARTSGLP